MTELAAIDLNLLVVLHALLTERHVTRAAAKVGLSQSAASHALSRLRDLYGDPLLVRSGRTLEPTPRAAAMLPTLTRSLGELHDTVAGTLPFDPERARRTFKLGTADYGQAVLCAPLLALLAREAPHVDVAFAASPHVFDLIDDGEIDLAVLVMENKPRRGHVSRVLFTDDFVCMVRRDHPTVKRRLTLRQYLELRHVVVAPTGAPGSVVDSALSRRGLVRRVAARIPSFLAAPIVVAGTDFINTGPARLARVMAKSHPIRLVPPPIALPSFELRLVWHRRFDNDEAHRWLREAVARVARPV